VAALLGLSSSVLFLQFFLKVVVVHLAHPYDRRLPKASSVSLGFLCFVFPILYGFLGGPLKVALTTSGWSLASYASLFSAFFVGSFQVQFAPFQCQALVRWLDLSPSRDCEVYSAGKGSFASYAKRHLPQLDASLHLLDAAAFNRCILTLSLALASRRLPVPPFLLPFPPHWSVAHLFGAIPRLGRRGSAPDLVHSVMPCAVWLGVMIFP
jgi:uncharacterized protein YhhL (DUF1145 family)